MSTDKNESVENDDLLNSLGIYEVIEKEDLSKEEIKSEKDRNNSFNRKEKIKKEKKSKNQKKLVTIFSSLILLTGGVFAFLSFSESSIPTAKNYIAYNEDAQSACDNFTSAKLDCSISWDENSDKPHGELVSQSIEPGKRVKKSTSVVLTYSKGPKESKLPELSGLQIEEAKKKLYDVGVIVKEVNEIDGGGLAEGIVVSSDKKTDDEVKNGDQITLNISNGSSKAPDWNGKTKEFVEADAKNLNLNVTFKEEESDKTSGVVIGQSPNAGESIIGNSIEVTISKSYETKTLTIPDVIGKSSTEAQTTLAVAGFRHIVPVVVPTSEVTSATVSQIVPGVGQTADSDENIVLIVTQPLG